MTEIIQGSPEWHQIRCGKVTASRVADVIAKTKTGPSASRANYLAELVAERLTGQPSQGFSNAAMQWGTDHEPEARAAYEFMTDQSVIEIGFVDHPTISMTGASPDGLVGEIGLVEIKAPNTSTQIDTLLSGKIPQKYMTQMMWQMACTGRKWCDFVSYDPRMPTSMQLFVKRVEFDAATVSSLETDVRMFLVELDQTVAQLEALYQRKAA